MVWLKRKLRWRVRSFRSNSNKILLRFFSVTKLKELNAKLYYKRNLDLDCPQKLNEKILYLTYHSDTHEWSKLADKYEVRRYVEEKGYKDILVPIFGVYDSYKAINFEQLPQAFVLKATHGCDMNFICKDKEVVNWKKLEKQVEFWLANNWAYIALELHYLRIPPRLICEQFLESSDEIIDYKFFCCNGKLQFIEVCSERSKGPYLDVFMPDWSYRAGVIVGAKNCPKQIKQPEHFEQMKKIAEDLAADFSFVRVDLYEVNEKIYFGEMTFTPATGVLIHFSEEFLIEQGKILDIGLAN